MTTLKSQTETNLCSVWRTPVCGRCGRREAFGEKTQHLNYLLLTLLFLCIFLLYWPLSRKKLKYVLHRLPWKSSQYLLVFNCQKQLQGSHAVMAFNINKVIRCKNVWAIWIRFTSSVQGAEQLCLQSVHGGLNVFDCLLCNTGSAWQMWSVACLQYIMLDFRGLSNQDMKFMKKYTVFWNGHTLIYTPCWLHMNRQWHTVASMTTSMSERETSILCCQASQPLPDRVFWHWACFSICCPQNLDIQVEDVRIRPILSSYRKRIPVTEGYVEIKDDGKWKQICNTEWSQFNSRVICGMFGFPGERKYNARVYK